MGKFVKGDVVVAPFPFSDLSASKKRPALVVATLTGDDVILCQITSKAISDSYAVPLSTADFKTGTLHQDSNIRPNRLFTADSMRFNPKRRPTPRPPDAATAVPSQMFG